MRLESASFLPAARYGTIEHRDNVIAQQLQPAGLYYGFTHNYTSALSKNYMIIAGFREAL